MRLAKLFFISVIVIFALLTAIGLLFPSEVRVSRAVAIHSNADTLRKYLSDVKYWKLWMAGADTNTIQFLGMKTAGAGTVAKIGTGEVSITKETQDSIITVWKSEKGSVQNGSFVIYKDASGVNNTVQWLFTQQIGWYPWERFGSMANDKILGPVMEESLAKLKTVLEK